MSQNEELLETGDSSPAADLGLRLPYQSNIHALDSGFAYYKVRVHGAQTTISLDLLLDECMQSLFGGKTRVQGWLFDRATLITNMMIQGEPDSHKKDGEVSGKKRAAGLSRLVAREAWKLVIAPTPADIEFLQKIGVTHPLLAKQEKTSQ